MADRPVERKARAGLPQTSAGGLLDEVPWEFDPEAQDPSPLVATERYFLDFPWEPDEGMPAEGAETAEGTPHATGST